MNIYIKIILIIIISLLSYIGLYSILLLIRSLKYYKSFNYIIDNNHGPCKSKSCKDKIEYLDIPNIPNLDYNPNIIKYCANLIKIVYDSKMNYLSNNLIMNTKLYNNNKLFGILCSNKQDNDNIAWLVFRGTESFKDLLAAMTYNENKYNITKMYKNKKIHSQNDLFKTLKYVPNLVFNNNLLSAHKLKKHKNILIHSGFLDIYNNIRDKILKELNNIKPKYLIISGHSLGASIATIAALDLSLLGFNIVTYSFASPRVGNTEFSNLVNESTNLYRIVNTCDIIPDGWLSVTPNFKDYKKPYIFTHTGIIKTFTSNWKSLIHNHAIENYSENINNYK